MIAANLPLEKRAKIIEQLPWAKELEWQELEIYARFLEPFRLEKNETLFMEGDRKAFMVIILRGSIRVFKEDGAGGLQDLNIVKAGKILGEMALVDGAPRSASAVAIEETIILRLTSENFFHIQEQSARLGMKIYAQIARLLSQRLRLTSGSLVEHLQSNKPSSGEREREREHSYIGDQTIMGIRVPPAVSAALREEENLSAQGEEEIPAQVYVSHYLLQPDREPDAAAVVNAVNTVHRRLLKIERWLKLQQASGADREGKKSGSEGLLKTIFRT